MPVYLDCNATTPVDDRVAAVVLEYLVHQFGNAASRTHDFGAAGKAAVEAARRSVAQVVGAKWDEVIFTSGATESNNLALLGLGPYGRKTRRTHIVTTAIEHKAVLEPLQKLASDGFEVTVVRPTSGGWVDPDEIREAVRPETLLVSVMHANNETGVMQPIKDIAEGLGGVDAFFHVDAAQTFGKTNDVLSLQRIDLISISAHKIFGPKGIGALVARRRKFDRVPLEPLMFGGGHERGLRPGTLPVELIAGLGKAAEIARAEASERERVCRAFREQALRALAPLNPEFNGDQARCMSHVLNLSFPGIDSEAAIVALKGLVAVSNGSACTSQSYSPSHVLGAMELPTSRIQGALRLSWCHATEEVEWDEVVRSLRAIAA